MIKDAQVQHIKSLLDSDAGKRDFLPTTENVESIVKWVQLQEVNHICDLHISFKGQIYANWVFGEKDVTVIFDFQENQATWHLLDFQGGADETWATSDLSDLGVIEKNLKRFC